jgi:pilus assembly protein CpaE
VADTGSQLDDVTLTTIELSDLVVLVCTPDVPSIRATRAAMTLLAELGVSRENIAYVLNRTARRTEINAKDVQSLFTGYDMLGEVPADFSALQPFLNTGALMGEATPDIPLTRALRRFAMQIMERVPVARAA